MGERTILEGAEAATRGVLRKKVFLEISQNWPAACNFIRKETLAQVFSCEFCENSKNTFFIEYLWTTASQGGLYQPCGSIADFQDIFRAESPIGFVCIGS